MDNDQKKILQNRVRHLKSDIKWKRKSISDYMNAIENLEKEIKLLESFLGSPVLEIN